jgi:biotin carboxylase
MRDPVLAGKTLLIIGGSHEALAGIRMARDLGIRIIVSDRNPQAPGFALADGCILASTYHVDETVAAVTEWCQKHGTIDGVMCLATDVPHTVAAVAEALGLPGLPRAVAEMAVDKLAMKQRFDRDGVSIPWFSAVESPAHLAALASERGLSLVLKPVDSRGSRGVLRLTAGVDLAWAFAESHKYSPTGRVMVEEFLDGPQVSTESVVLDGVVHTPGFADRNYEFLERYAPNFIENGGSLPSCLPEDVQQQVLEVLGHASASLGIRTGIIKGDIVLPAGGPRVIELAARLSGGYFCTHSIPLNVGVSTVEAAIRLALGAEVDPARLQPRFNRGVAQRYLFPSPGRVIRVEGLDAAWKLPGVEVIQLTVAPGDIIRPPTDSNASAGMVLATADTAEEAVRRCEAALAVIRIETEAI